MVMPPPIRPTFDLDVPMTVEETVAALRAAFRAAGEHPFQSTGQHVVVTVPPGVRHFWSPCLTMEAQVVGPGVRLHGRFSPKPAIWTGFMLSYIALTTAGCFGLMFAASQAIIHRSPILAAGLALAFLLAALGMYLSSQLGSVWRGGRWTSSSPLCAAGSRWGTHPRRPAPRTPPTGPITRRIPPLSPGADRGGTERR